MLSLPEAPGQTTLVDDNLAQQSFVQGFILQSLTPLGEAWGITVVSNLKLIFAIKCLQDTPAKADTFKPVSACPKSGGLQLLLNVHMGSCLLPC